ncbi:MAG: baseplate J/gp47 family protein [Anaerolineae bacterium]
MTVSSERQQGVPLGAAIEQAPESATRPAPLASVIELSVEDSAVEAAGYLARVEGQRAILVIPPGSDWSEADIELIARRAVGLGLTVGLVSRESRLRAGAASAGLRAFGSVRDAQRRLAPREPALPKAATARQAVLRRYAPPALDLRRRTARRSPWAAAVAGVCLLAAALGLGLLAVATLPYGKVTVRPARMDVAAQAQVMARPGAKLDPTAQVIPARRLEESLSLSGGAATSGLRSQPEGKAGGTVVFINKQADPVTLPAGTPIETSGGRLVRFVTTQPAVLPAGVGSSVRITVTAAEGGPDSNVPPYTLNALQPSLALAAAAVNDAPMSGGTLRQEEYVTDQDVAELRASLLARLRGAAVGALRAQLGDGERLVADSLDVTVTNERLEVEPVSRNSASLGMTVRATALAYDPQAADAVARQALEKSLPNGFRLLGGYDFMPLPAERVIADAAGPGVTFDLAARGRAEANVDRAAVRDEVRGLTPPAAMQALGRRFALAEPAGVSLGPAWVAERWGRLPWLPIRTEVVVLGETP